MVRVSWVDKDSARGLGLPPEFGSANEGSVTFEFFDAARTARPFPPGLLKGAGSLTVCLVGVSAFLLPAAPPDLVHALVTCRPLQHTRPRRYPQGTSSQVTFPAFRRVKTRGSTIVISPGT